MALRGRLSDENEHRLVKNFELLLSDLDLNDIIAPFIASGYFEVGIEDIIKAEAQPPTPRNKNQKFLQKLLKCSDSAYGLLRTTLLEKGFHHIVDALDKTDVTNVSLPKARDRLEELGTELRELPLDDRSVMKFNLTMGKDMTILGHAMGFVNTEIDHIIMESHYSVATQMHKLFTKWRQRYSRDATLGLLTATLKKAESYGADVNWDKYDDALKDLKKSLSMD